MMLALLLSAILVLQISAYSCPSTPITVKNQGQVYSFPGINNGDMYDANQNCTWIVQISDGYYIEYESTVDLKNGAQLTFTELRGSLQQSYSYPTFLEVKGFMTKDELCDQLTIQLNTTEAGGSYRFKIIWKKKVPPAQPQIVNVQPLSYSILDLSQMEDPLNNTLTFAIEGQNQLFLIVDPRYSEDPNLVLEYDGPAVVPGADYNTLELDNYVQSVALGGLKSTQSALTLYSPEESADLDMFVIVNDIRVVQQFDFYGGMVVDLATTKPGACASAIGETCAFTFSTVRGDPVAINKIDFVKGGKDPVYVYEGIPANYSSATPLLTITRDTKVPYTFNVPTVTVVVAFQSQDTEVEIYAKSTETGSERVQSSAHESSRRAKIVNSAFPTRTVRANRHI